MTKHHLNARALFQQMDRKRGREGMSWRGVSRELGCVSQSIFTRLSDGDAGIHADTLISALVWLGLDREVAHLIERGDGRRNQGPLRMEQWSAAHNRLVEQLCAVRPGLRPEQAHATLQALRTLRWELQRPGEPESAVCGDESAGLGDTPMVCVRPIGHQTWHEDARGRQWRTVDSGMSRNGSPRKRVGSGG
jgi:hypothetical protein